MKPDVWKKNAMGEINAAGFVILAIDLIIFGTANSRAAAAQSSPSDAYSPVVRGLIMASPGLLIGLVVIALYSRVTIDFKAATLEIGKGMLPFVKRKRFSLERAKTLVLDGSKGRYATYRATIVFDDGQAAALCHGDGFLNLDDITNLAEWLNLPVETTPSLDQIMPDSLRAKLAVLPERVAEKALAR